MKEIIWKAYVLLSFEQPRQYKTVFVEAQTKDEAINKLKEQYAYVVLCRPQERIYHGTMQKL